MQEPPDIPSWKKEDFVDVIGRAYHRDKKKRRVKQASGWVQKGQGRDFVFKVALDGRSMLVVFGGVHPKMYNFVNRQDQNKFTRQLLRNMGYAEDKRGRFYVGNRPKT